MSLLIVLLWLFKCLVCGKFSARKKGEKKWGEDEDEEDASFYYYHKSPNQVSVCQPTPLPPPPLFLPPSPLSIICGWERGGEGMDGSGVFGFKWGRMLRKEKEEKAFLFVFFCFFFLETLVQLLTYSVFKGTKLGVGFAEQRRGRWPLELLS